MKTIEEMIAVMQAYADGKKIECRNICTKPKKPWIAVKDPLWDWVNYDYQVKPEPKYRQYANAEECFKDVIKHGGWVQLNSNKEHYLNIVDVFVNQVEYGNGCVAAFGNVFAKAVWADDGTPCGVLEEE